MGKTLNQIQGSTVVQQYLKELQKYPPISREEEERTLKRAQKGDAEAVDRIVTANLRFVVSVALEYQGRGLPLSDLIAEGNMGLLEALKRFDPGRKTKFISYAVWWIHQSIRKAIKRSATVTQPSNRQDDMVQISKRWRALTQKLGRTPTLDEVSIDMKISRKRAERALRSALSNLSLDAPIDASDDSARTLLQILESEGTDPDQQVFEKNRRSLLERALACCDDREQMVVRTYFGLDGKEPRTLKQIGAELGVTRERVRQIKQRALGKLSRFLTRRYAGTSDLLQDLL